MNQDGFVLVKRKGRRRKQGVNKNLDQKVSLFKQLSADDAQRETNEVIKQINQCRDDLLDSQFYKDVQGLVQGDDVVFPGNHKDLWSFQDMMAYGIGKFSSCSIARHQFAFMLVLRDLLEIPGECFLFEPVLSSQEMKVVKDFNCKLIEVNEEAKRKVSAKTLFYMLHCGKPLYNNLLWANWCQEIGNVVILGNSFSSYQERLPARQLQEEAMYIHRILPLTDEAPLPQTFHHKDIFNDSSFHFIKTPPNPLMPSFWSDCPEPEYNVDDPEFIRA